MDFGRVKDFDIDRAGFKDSCNGIQGRVMRLEISKLKERFCKQDIIHLATLIEDQFVNKKTTDIRDRLFPGRQQVISLDETYLYLWNISSGCLIARFSGFLYEHDIRICSVFFQRCGERGMLFQDDESDLAYGISFPKQKLQEFQKRISDEEVEALHIPSTAAFHQFRWVLCPPAPMKKQEASSIPISRTETNRLENF